MKLFAITWQTHPGNSSNPARIAREELPFQAFAKKVRWLRNADIPYTLEMPAKWREVTHSRANEVITTHEVLSV
jgi:hypothetical protein